MSGGGLKRALTAYDTEVRPEIAWLDGGVVDSPSL